VISPPAPDDSSVTASPTASAPRFRDVVGDDSLSAVLVRAFLFCAAAYIASFALASLLVGMGRGGADAAGAGVLERATWTAYLLLVSAVPAAFGFALVTSVFPAFRALSPARVAWIAAAGGVVVYVVQTTGLGGFLYWIPLPLPGRIGAAVRLLLPGIAVGAAAVFAIAFARAARSRATRPAGPSSG
jgi:hypothetical protein